ncbi:MAG: hypothetical protein ACO3UU_12585 [Minisyncoccia bacterium]
MKSKTRGFVYSKNDNYFYTCFNCDKGTTLRSLIGFLDQHLEQEYFTEDFKAFVESVSDKKLDQTGPRVIIPFYSRSGDLVAFQGRALDSYSMRYITVKIDREQEKIFGLDKVDPMKPIYVVEGPFDSLFLPNAIATADSNLSAAANVFDKSKFPTASLETRISLKISGSLLRMGSQFVCYQKPLELKILMMQ